METEKLQKLFARLPKSRTSKLGIAAEDTAVAQVDGQIGAELVECLESGDATDASFALWFVEHLCPREDFLKAIQQWRTQLETAVLRLIAHPEFNVREAAVRAFTLLGYGRKDYHHEMLKLLRSGDSAIRRIALEMAPHFLSKDDLGELLTFRNDAEYGETLGMGGPLRYTSRDLALAVAERISGMSFANSDCQTTIDGRTVSYRSWAKFDNWLAADRKPSWRPFLNVGAACAIVALCLPTNGLAASLLLTGGIVHTVSGPTFTNASLLVRDGKIAAVGQTITEAADQTLDLKGQHVFPGLIAPMTVLGLQEIDGVRATRDTTESGDFHPDVLSWISVNPDSELLPVARANGYTHAQPIPLGGVVSGQSAVIALAGWTIEDLAVKRAAALHVFWPSFALDTTPKERAANPANWKSLEDQVKERDKKLRELDEFFNEAEAYAKAKAAAKDTNAFKPVPAWEAMLPVIRGEIPLNFHADEVRQIRSAVEWVAKRRLKAALAGGRDAWRVVDLLATNKVPVLFEHVFTQPARDTDPYDVHFAAPAVLVRAGVKVSFTDGTDRFGASNVRNVPYAAAQAVAFGLSRDEAIRGLTLYPAEVLGVADRLGSLEAGKEASFFVADGDILDIRTQVKRLWIAGKEVSLDSRHTRLYEKYRNRPKP
jgi:imidazolonepropionase-like amidohydrolase